MRMRDASRRAPMNGMDRKLCSPAERGGGTCYEATDKDFSTLNQLGSLIFNVSVVRASPRPLIINCRYSINITRETDLIAFDSAPINYYDWNKLRQGKQKLSGVDYILWTICFTCHYSFRLFVLRYYQLDLYSKLKPISNCLFVRHELIKAAFRE